MLHNIFVTWQEQDIIPHFKIVWTKFGGSETNTNRLLVFLEDFLDMFANTCLRKLLEVAKEDEFPARKCRACINGGECSNMQIYCLVPLHKGKCFQKYYTQPVLGHLLSGL
jgi:hypothetical protein